MAKKKGPTFEQAGRFFRKDPDAPEIETKEYTVHRTGLQPPSSNISYFYCPFCGDEVKAYVWSICGGGKRCDCGALFGAHGVGYHFKERD